jgi:SMC interacting uncharacterized protein involved in chromosome segregation
LAIRESNPKILKNKSSKIFNSFQKKDRALAKENVSVVVKEMTETLKMSRLLAKLTFKKNRLTELLMKYELEARERERGMRRRLFDFRCSVNWIPTLKSKSWTW